MNDIWCEPMLPGVESYWVCGERMTFIATGDETAGSFFAALMQCPFREENEALYPLHSHPVWQGYHVLRGSIVVESVVSEGEHEVYLHASDMWVRRQVVREGESVALPPETIHRAWTGAPGPCHAIMMMAPSGIEHMYREIGTPARLTVPAPFPGRTNAEYWGLVAAAQRCMIQHNLSLTTIA